MPDQPIASVAALGSEETVKYLKDISTALIEIWDSIDKTGKAGDQILGYMKEMPTIQQNMLTNMQQSLAVDQQLLTATTQRHKLLKDMNDLKKQGLDYDKEGLDTEEKRRLAESRKAAGQLMHPGAMLEEKGLGMLGGPAQIAAIVGIAAMSATAEAVSKMRSITRTGGEGMMGEGMGVGNAMSIEASMRFAAMSIPFLKEKYASTEQLTAGAATMYGQGGIRGENLAGVMEFLPKAAHEAGMSFQDASNIMAKSNRIYEQSPKELEEGFKIVTDAAKDAGYNVTEFSKFIYETSFKTHQYGVDTESLTKVTKDLFDLTLKDKMSKEGQIAFTAEQLQHGLQLTDMASILTKANKEAVYSTIALSDVLNLRKTIETVLIDKSNDYNEILKKMPMNLGNFAKAVDVGAMGAGSVTMALDVLAEHFTYTSDEALNYAAGISQAAKEVGYSKQDLMKVSLDLSQTFQKVIHDPKEAAMAGAAVSISFVKELKNLDISAQDLTKMFSFTTEKLRMLPGETMALTNEFIKLAKSTDTSTANIVNWYTQLTSGMIPFAKDVKDAGAAATMALESTVSLFNNGKITVGDYTQIIKTQFEVFGKDLASSDIQFNTLAQIVDKTNVRMSELASQTAELAKINRQYGFDQSISNALLVTFNEGLRSGSVTLGDLKSVIRGPGGSSEGMRAMIASELMQRGKFQGMNIMAAVEIGLPDLMETGGVEEPGVGQIGTREDVLKRRAERLSNRGEVNEIWRNVMAKMVGSAGGDNETNRLAAAMKLFPAFTGGGELQAYGKDRTRVLEMLASGDFTKATDELKKIQKEGGGDPEEPQNKFRSTVKTLSNGTDKFVTGLDKSVTAFQTAVNVFRSSIGLKELGPKEYGMPKTNTKNVLKK